MSFSEKITRLLHHSWVVNPQTGKLVPPTWLCRMQGNLPFEEYNFATKDEAFKKAEALRATIETHGYLFEKISTENTVKFTNVWKTTTKHKGELVWVIVSPILGAAVPSSWKDSLKTLMLLISVFTITGVLGFVNNSYFNFEKLIRGILGLGTLLIISCIILYVLWVGIKAIFSKGKNK